MVTVMTCRAYLFDLNGDTDTDKLCYHNLFNLDRLSSTSTKTNKTEARYLSER